MSSARLLQLALPLVQSHGFTRKALALSVLSLPEHVSPLSDSAVSNLWGTGDTARRTLVNAWLDEGISTMKHTTSTSSTPLTVGEILHARLARNQPVLEHLPEAFALLASSTTVPILDPRPALKHAARIADEACHVSGDNSLHLSWYARRGSLAAIYGAAELHQLTSPETAFVFLDSLLDASSTAKSAVDNVALYSSYIYKSWGGILKSSGVNFL